MKEYPVIKSLIIKAFYVTVFVLAILFCISQCGRCSTKPVLSDTKTDKDTIKAIKKRNIQLEKSAKFHENNSKAFGRLLVVQNIKIDSLTKKTRAVEKRYNVIVSQARQNKTDTVLTGLALDVCDTTIKALHELCDQKDTAYKIQSNQVVELTKANSDKDLQITNDKEAFKTFDSVVINKDSDIKKLKKEVRRQKIIKVVAVVGTVIFASIAVFILH